MRTEGFSADNVDLYERDDDASDKASQEDDAPATSSNPGPLDVEAAQLSSPSIMSDSEPTPRYAPPLEGAPSIDEGPVAPSLPEGQSSTDTVAHVGDATTKTDESRDGGSEGSAMAGKVNEDLTPGGEGQIITPKAEAETVSPSIAS